MTVQKYLYANSIKKKVNITNLIIYDQKYNSIITNNRQFL